MVTIDVFASLSMVKDEIDVTLDQAQSEIQMFTDSSAEENHLKKCMDHIVQLYGVCRVIGLQGPVQMLNELQMIAGEAIAMLEAGSSEGVDNYLVVLGKGVMVLQQYLNYIYAKQQMLPVLLIPSINEARRVSGKNILPEDHFFTMDVKPVQRDYGYSGSNPNLDELSKSAHRLRHMYQVGFLGMIRGGDSSHVRFVKRSLERIDRLSGDCPMGQLWWLALAVAEVFLNEDIVANPTRLAILGRIDRQVKRLVYEGIDVLSESPPESLCKECLYLISLSTLQNGIVGEVKSAFSIGDQHVKDSALQRELGLMSGPGGAVIDSVVSALKEELVALEDHLDLSARGVDVEPHYFLTVADDLKRVAHTLFMLGLADISNALKEQSEIVKGWAESGVDLEGEAYHQVADSVLIADNAISELLRGSKPGDKVEPGTSTISLTLLDEARSIVIVESRAGLASVKRSISSYLDTHWDTVHLKTIPEIMNGIRGGLLFLQLDRASTVIDGCDKYIRTLLEPEEENAEPSAFQLETLADAMTSIDYYLEGIEERKPIGEGILELSEESVKELGFG